MNLDDFKGIKFECDKAVQEVALRCALKLAAQINASAPRRSGIYANDWIARQDPQGATTGNTGPHRPLSWLLEFGHIARDGSYVAARPHIRSAYEDIKDEYEQLLKEEIINSAKLT